MGSVRGLTLHWTGDPLVVGSEVRSFADLCSALELDAGSCGLLTAAPGVRLLFARRESAETEGTDARAGRHEPQAGPALRWVRLTHAPTIDGAEPVRGVALIEYSIAESSHALGHVALLLSCLRESDVVLALEDARTRESVVRAFAGAENRAYPVSLSTGDVLRLLAADAGGLDARTAAIRLAACGPNRIESVGRRSLASRALEQFTSFFAVLLWVGGACAILAGMSPLGLAIFAVIVVNGLFGFFQEYRAERAVEALRRMLPREIAVVRSGAEVRAAVEMLVPGDVVRLREGDPIPADGQLIEARGLRVDQSALTGESHPVFKLPSEAREYRSVRSEEHHERVFAGTHVVAGEGAMVVSATGMTSSIGAIARMTQTLEDAPSPLQREMVRVTRVVTVLALSFGVTLFALGVFVRGMPIAQGFLFALGVIVANVPEGLLPTLTLALAIGVQRLARHRSLVKRLSAVETLGATTVICTDKTGTLTENRMQLRSVWVEGGRVEFAGGTPRSRAVSELLESAALASHATRDHGDPTEMALVRAAEACGTDVESRRSAAELVAPFPFDSFRKRMTLVRRTEAGSTAYVKGAARELIDRSSHLAAEGGDSRVPLSAEHRASILAEHDRIAAEGLRVLAVARRALPAGYDPSDSPASDRGGEWADSGAADRVERDLTLMGLVALWDPPRPEVAEAIRACETAGIRVIMVTGDYGLTAGAIARQIGLDVRKVVTGDEVERLSPEALTGLVSERGLLFARTTPAHKLAIVRALRERGDIVAVTGDGVNDAPALKAADIGVAMGGRGSEVAKEAATIVITDDNFASIVRAVRLGRGTYANIGKFVTYIFASNVAELVPFVAWVFLKVPLPLTVMQVLAVDLGTDLLPALALGAEPPEPGLMNQPPRSRHERLLSRGRLLRAYAFLGVAEAALAMFAYFATYWFAGWRPGMPMDGAGELYRRATTMTFAGIVAAQVGNVFACRTDRESVFRVGIARNRYVLAGIAAEVALLAALIYVPPLAAVFGLAPLRWEEIRVLLAFPVVMVLLEEARKAVLRRGARKVA